MQDVDENKQDTSDVLENGINAVNKFVKNELPAIKSEAIEAKDNITDLASELKKDIISTRDDLSNFIDDFKEVKSNLKNIFKLF